MWLLSTLLCHPQPPSPTPPPLSHQPRTKLRVSLKILKSKKDITLIVLSIGLYNISSRGFQSHKYSDYYLFYVVVPLELIRIYMNVNIYTVIFYSLFSLGLFSINSNTGTLSTESPGLDREASEEYSLTVTVRIHTMFASQYPFFSFVYRKI